MPVYILFNLDWLVFLSIAGDDFVSDTDDWKIKLDLSIIQSY